MRSAYLKSSNKYCSKVDVYLRKTRNFSYTQSAKLGELKKTKYIKQRKKSIKLTRSSAYKFLLSTLLMLLLFPLSTREKILANKFKKNKKPLKIM